MAAPTALTVAQVVEAGVTLTTVAADTANGNSFDNSNGNVFVVLDNQHATLSETYNFAVQNQPPAVGGSGFGTVSKTSPIAIAVPALTKKLVGPFAKGAFNDASGLVQVTYSGSGTPFIQAFTVKGLGL